MTGLQKEANKKLNLSAEETLNIAQSLYEKKFITYPRTGSKYIPEDVWDEIPSALNAKENAVYDMIAFRLLEVLSGACIKEITDVALQALHYVFTAKGCKVLEAGWRSIKGNFSDDDTESVQDLPELKKGDELKIKEATVLEKTTKAPVLYTEAGLLSAMESAEKEMKSKAGKKFEKSNYKRK